MSPAVLKVLSEIFAERRQQIITIKSVSGGSINQSFKVVMKGGDDFFCKTNVSGTLPQMFEKEKNGIEAIAESKTIGVPRNVMAGEAGEEQWIVMEWIKK